MKHTQKNGILKACQSNHSFAKSTDNAMRMSINSNQDQNVVDLERRAESVGGQMLAVNGKKLEPQQSPPTVASASAVAKKARPSSPLTTSGVVVRSIGAKGLSAGISINGSGRKAAQKKSISSFASTVTARKDSGGSARTRNKIHALAGIEDPEKWVAAVKELLIQ